MSMYQITLLSRRKWKLPFSSFEAFRTGEIKTLLYPYSLVHWSPLLKRVKEWSWWNSNLLTLISLFLHLYLKLSFFFSLSRNFSIRFLRDVNQCDSWTWQESIKRWNTISFSISKNVVTTNNGFLWEGKHYSVSPLSFFFVVATFVINLWCTLGR